MKGLLKKDKTIIFIGFFFASIGFIFNEWLLAALVSPRNNFPNSFSERMMILGFDVFMIGVGILFLIFRKRREALINLSLLLCSLVLGVVLFETGAYFITELNTKSKRTILEPNIRRTFIPSSDMVSGIEGTSIYTTNSKGIRGREFSKSDFPRILCAGGSTTDCVLLDDKETWPFLFERKLSAKYPNVWVGSAASSGMTLHTQASLMKGWLDIMREIDMIVVLSGINDLALALEKSNKFTENKNYTEKAISFFRGLTMVSLFKKGLDSSLSSEFERLDEAGKVYEYRRNKRRRARLLIKNLPDLTETLSQYTNDINKIIDICSDAEIRVCFMTQPTMWKPKMSEQEEKLLWFGWVGNPGEEKADYYSTEVLSEGMLRYNEVLKSVCKKRNIDCIDLAGILPRDITVFYDDCHFNESGAEQLADVISSYSLQNEY